MPKVCCVPQCKNNKEKRPDLAFYQLPTLSDKRQAWLQAIGRKDEKGALWSPRSRYNYVCQKHFITEQKSINPTHPDYVPSIFPSRPCRISPELKIRRWKNSLKRTAVYLKEESGRWDIQDWREPVGDEEQGTETDVETAGGGGGGEGGGGGGCDEIGREEEIGGEDTGQGHHKTGDEDWMRSSDQHVETAWQYDQDSDYSEEDKIQEKEGLAGSLTLEKEATWPRDLKAGSVRGDDLRCRELTGLSWSTFLHLCSYLMTPYIEVGGESTLAAEDQLFAVLLKLRQNPSTEVLSQALGVRESTVRDMFSRWINLLYAKLRFMIHWPDREYIHSTTPPAMKTLFPKLTCIVDCLEIRIESPKRKKRTRAQPVKYFMACSPAGSIIYLSTGRRGKNHSHVEIVKECGFISPYYHHHGDQILADRCFQMEGDLAAFGAHLITSPFTQGCKQLSGNDLDEARVTSNVRIHIERVLGALKGRFRILDATLPLHLVQTQREERDGRVTMLDKLVHVCAALINMSGSVLHSF